MRQRSLWRSLLAAGEAAARRAEAGRIRATALFCAALVVAAGFATMAAVHAAYAGKALRVEARSPVPRDGAAGRPATLLWSDSSDTLADHRQYDIVFLSPLTANAPLPPGVDTWPRRGEVLLSPALRRAGGREGIEQRYGRTVGTIGQEGLADPSERLAYIRPRHDLSPDRAEAIVGFGPDVGTPAVGLGPWPRDDKPEWLFQLLIIGTMLVPGAALLFIAARAGSHARDRRTALVAALGGTRGDRALIAVAEAWKPVILGTTAAAVLAATAMTVDVRLPVTGYVLSSADLRHWAWLLALALLVSVAVVLSAVVLTNRVYRHRQSTRPVGIARSRLRWGVLCPVMVLFTLRGPGLFPPATPPYILLTWAGVVGTLLTLPVFVAACTALLGRVLARVARSRRLAGPLVAGRRMSTHPGPVARMITGVAIGLCLLMQVLAWQSIFGSQAQAARRTIDRIGESAVEVVPRGAVTETQLVAFLARLPSDTRVVAMRTREGVLTFQGTCRSLRSLSLGCPAEPARIGRGATDERVRELIAWHSPPDATITVVRDDHPTATVARSKDGDSTLVLVSADGHDLPIPRLKELSYQVLPRGAAVDVPGSEWLIGGTPNRDQARWSVLFGGVGIAVLALAAGLAGMAEFLRHGRALAPLSVLTGGYRVFRGSAAWSVLVPLGLSGVLGVTVGVLIAAPITSAGANPISGTLLAGCAGLVVALGVVMWMWAASTSVRQARAWRPSGD